MFRTLNITTSSSTTEGFDDLSVWFTVTSLLEIIGLTTNVSFVLAVYNDRKSSAGPRLLIGNLAVSRFLVSVVFLPAITIASYDVARGRALPYHNTYCYILAGTFLTSDATSWAEVILAINRLVAICFPYKYIFFKTKFVSIILIAGSWVVSVTLVAITFGEMSWVISVTPHGICIARPYGILGQLSFYMWVIIPYSLVGLASAVIFTTAHFRLRQSEVSSPNFHMARIIRKRLVIARAMFYSLLWCLACVLPLTIMMAYYPHVLARNPLLSRWMRNAPSLQYAVEPLLYFAVSQAYRRSLVSLLRRETPQPTHI